VGSEVVECLSVAVLLLGGGSATLSGEIVQMTLNFIIQLLLVVKTILQLFPKASLYTVSYLVLSFCIDGTQR
jgi:hypothetical protein